MEGSLHDQQRLIRTYGYVLRPHKLPCHVPDYDELSLRTRNCRTMAHDLHGRYGDTYGKTPRRNRRTTSPTTPRTSQEDSCETPGTQSIPETGEMHLRT